MFVGLVTSAVTVTLGDVVGYFVLDSPQPPPGYMLYLVLWNLPAGFIGGWVAAWIAGRKPMSHAGYLAGIVLAMGVWYMLTGAQVYEANGIDLPPWYLPLLPVTGVTGILLGGWVCARRKTATPQQN